MNNNIACSACYGTGYGVDGKPCPCGCRAATLPAAPAPTEQAPGDMPTLPQHLLDVIGEYGCARSDDVGEMEILHRWETLIAGIKNYAWAALAARQAPTYVPIAVHQSDFAQGWHPKDDTKPDVECQKVLDARGDDSGQGLDPYWKWGFRAGWASRQAPDSRDTERLEFLHRSNKDAEGYEYGICKVKHNPAGNIESFLWCLSDHSDVDAAIAQEKAQ